MRQSTTRFDAHDVAIRTWVYPDKPGNPSKILCFPFSGGGSTAFKPLAAALGPAWRVSAVNPPGHGLGALHRALDSVPELVARYLECLPPELIEGAVVLGYSVGGYVAHHLLTALAARPGAPRPRGLVMCAVPPYERRDRAYSELPDGELFDGLSQLGGIPKGLGDAKSAFSMFAHVVRADFRAYERCPVPSGRLDLPTLVVAGSEDPIYRPEWFSLWGRFFSSPTPATVRGSHVFLPDNSPGLARAIEAWASALPSARGPAKGPVHAT